LNELLLILNLVIIYGTVILLYRLFDKSGLYAMTAIATILANIEVLIVVNAFGMEMTLGNILFASTFLISDILSENHGKKAAMRSVLLGSIAALFLAVLSQLWLLYTPAESDWASESFRTLFTNTPRLVFASLFVYIVTQIGDVFLYHHWWNWTTKKFGNSRKMLWVRNNGSTLISQLLNAILYTILAFYGMYPNETLLSIIISSYIIFICTSLLDTPVVYVCRLIHDKRKTQLEEA